MSKSIFISCLLEDKHLIGQLNAWSEAREFGDIMFIHAMQQDKVPEGDDAVYRHILEYMDKAVAIAVLVGKDTHNHDWIDWEVKKAKKRTKKIFCIRIPNTKGGVPPILNDYAIIEFKLEDLKKNFSVLK